MDNAHEARELVHANLINMSFEEKACACEQTSIIISLKNLMSYQSVRKRIEENTLMLLGWYFNIQSGELFQLDPDTFEFEPLVES